MRIVLTWFIIKYILAICLTGNRKIWAPLHVVSIQFTTLLNTGPCVVSQLDRTAPISKVVGKRNIQSGLIQKIYCCSTGSGTKVKSMLRTYNL